MGNLITGYKCQLRKSFVMNKVFSWVAEDIGRSRARNQNETIQSRSEIAEQHAEGWRDSLLMAGFENQDWVSF